MTKEEFEPIGKELETMCNTWGQSGRDAVLTRGRVLLRHLQQFDVEVVRRGVDHFFASASGQPPFPSPGEIIRHIEASASPYRQDDDDEGVPMMSAEEIAEFEARAAAILAGKKTV